MSKITWFLAGAAQLAALCLGGFAAQAAVIPGPALTLDGVKYSVTGLAFTPLRPTELQSVVYQNQGQADTVVLTDKNGSVLFTQSVPAGTPSDLVTMNIALSATGVSYFLLQTVASNELYADFNGTLPSNSDIAITASGTFGVSIANAIANADHSNKFWAAFNDITTTSLSTTVPEASTWAMMLVGFAGLGLAGYRGARKGSAPIVDCGSRGPPFEPGWRYHWQLRNNSHLNPHGLWAPWVRSHSAPSSARFWLS